MTTHNTSDTTHVSFHLTLSNSDINYLELAQLYRLRIQLHKTTTPHLDTSYKSQVVPCISDQLAIHWGPTPPPQVAVSSQNSGKCLLMFIGLL